MGHVGKTVTQNVVSGSEITDGTVTGADLASDIAISTSGAITTTGAFTSKGIDDNASSEMLNLEQNANSTTSKMLMVGENNNINNWSYNGRSGIVIEGTANAILALGRSSTAGHSAYIYHDGTLGITNQEATPINIGHNTGTGISIDANNYVTKPYQVYVQAKGNSTRHNQTSANTEQSLDFTEVTDNTNSFAISGGIFTAPVAGRYFIHYYTSQKSNTSYINLILKHNSTTIVRDYNELPNISADWVSQQVTAILNLGASDTVQPFMVSGGTNAYSLENEYRGCSIYLLG